MNQILSGYSTVRVKVIDNKPYIYAQKSGTTTADIFVESLIILERATL